MPIFRLHYMTLLVRISLIGLGAFIAPPRFLASQESLARTADVAESADSDGKRRALKVIGALGRASSRER